MKFVGPVTQTLNRAAHPRDACVDPHCCDSRVVREHDIVPKIAADHEVGDQRDA